VTPPIPRLRIIAGPNGSGKSTIKALLPREILGVYVNPDEIELALSSKGAIDLAAYGLTVSIAEVTDHFRNSTLWKSTGLSDPEGHIHIQNMAITFEGIKGNSYLASLTADFIRHKLLEKGISFTFETVMSHSGKVDLLKTAQVKGYRTYLYYIATEDPEINLARVRTRVREGGHDVPLEKVQERYERSLELLLDAIRATNRAYIFDNSRDGAQSIFIAEVTDGKDIVARHNPLPAWFAKYVWRYAKP
jgi:predicted ABC-type ATPase